MTLDESINTSWWALRISLGLAAFLAGLDKFFNLLTNWSMYLSPLVERFMPVSGDTLMRCIGVVEMLVGLAILTRWTRTGAYVASAWLLGIALNLLTTGGFFDIAVRDGVMASSAFVLANLSEARDLAHATKGLGTRLDGEPVLMSSAR